MTIVAVQPVPGHGFIAVTDTGAGDQGGNLRNVASKVWKVGQWFVAPIGDVSALDTNAARQMFQSVEIGRLIKAYRRLRGRDTVDLIVSDGDVTFVLRGPWEPYHPDPEYPSFFGCGAEHALGGYVTSMAARGRFVPNEPPGVRMIEAMRDGVQAAIMCHRDVNGRPDVRFAVRAESYAEVPQIAEFYEVTGASTAFDRKACKPMTRLLTQS